MTVGVYAIVNTVTGATYIGASADIERRWAGHQHLLWREKHPYQALLGPDAALQVLEQVERTSLPAAEQRWFDSQEAINRSRAAYPPDKPRPRLPRLRPLRVRKALSQRELARAAGVSADTIRRIEAQGASAQFPTVRKLAEALGVEPAELMAPEQSTDV